MTVVDQVLAEPFTSFNSSVDRIATFREVRAEFLARLPREVCGDADEDNLIWRLFQLRKTGRLPKPQSRRNLS